MTGSDRRRDPQQARNRKLAIICAATFFGMVGAAYAAVPLYKAFCQATGFGGTVRKAEVAPDKVLDRTLQVRFDVNVRDLPWDFSAEQTSQTIRIGDTAIAFFKVTNRGPAPVTGQAAYNVLPEQAGPYFQKLQCFCFSEQTIAPGKTVEFPVVYFVDPKYADDFETKGNHVVTLSYTFYPVEKPAKAQASAGASQAKASQALGGTASAGL